MDLSKTKVLLSSQQMVKFCFVVVCLCWAWSSWSQPIGGSAVLCAYDNELAPYLDILENPTEVKVAGLSFHVGKIHGQSVVVGCTGVGKTNAGMTTALVLNQFQPKRVMFSGVAGSLDSQLRVGDVVVAASMVQHDLGTLAHGGTVDHWGVRSPLGGHRNPTWLPSDPVLLALAQTAAPRAVLERVRVGTMDHIAQVHQGQLATGDVFVADEAYAESLHKRLRCSFVDMEGGAVAQVCYQYGVPVLVVKGISHHANKHAQSNWMEFKHVAARNAAGVVLVTLQAYGERWSQ